MKKIISILICVSILIASSLCLCSCNEVKSKVVSYAHFNTKSEIYAYGDTTESEFNKYVSIVDEALGYYHKLFDIYFGYTGVENINTINRNAGKTPVKVDKALVDFLLYCKELYTLTNGKTNVMLGSVLKIWHDVREQAEDDFGYLNPDELPTAEELAEAAKHTSIDLLVIDEEASTVYISDPKASIDVGAIAKGYTVQILYDLLVAEGADSVVLNIGGNIRTIGVKPNGKNWTNGITNPDKEADDPIKCRIQIGDTSVVTSGDYERYFISGDKNYHHIIDPVTLMPAEYFSSVSIITENSGLADALSTALFCMSYEDGLALVDSLSDVEAVWIFKDGTVQYTDGVVFIK